MKFLATLIVLGTTVIVGCGGDNGSSAASDSGGSSVATTAAPAQTSLTTAPAATVAAPPTAAAPVTSAPPQPPSTTPNEGRAALAVLTPVELPGWTQQPADQDGDDGSEFDLPECAALAALDDAPGLQDDVDITLVAPDGKTQVDENVTVGDATSVQLAFDTFADPATGACLTAVFTTVLAQPGVLPDGVQMTGLEFTQQPLTGGDQAVGYIAAITVTGTETGLSAPLGVRFDAVRTGDAIAVLTTLTGPGADPVDPATVATAAGSKLAAAG